MKFDKTRVYTAVNADELKIGSKCIFADTLGSLRTKVENKKMQNFITTLKYVRNDGDYDRFYTDDDFFCFAYLIEPPEIDSDETENGWNFDFHKIPQKPQGEILILFENGFMSRYQDPFPIGQLAIAWRVIPILSKKKRKHITENMLRKYK